MQARVKHLMIVDDDPDLRQILREQIVEHFGRKLRVVESSDGVEATQKIEKQSFDCIITDLKMPKGDGNFFIKWLKEDKINRTVPIIILTGNPDRDLADEYKNIHMVEKPWDREALIKLVETELRLGKINQRIPADLLTAFIEGSKSVLLDLFGEPLKVLPPNLKLSGKTPEINLLTGVCVRIGDKEGRLVLGAEDSVIEHLVMAAGKKQSRDLGSIKSLLSNKIFKATGAVLLKKYKKPPLFENKVAIDDPSSYAAKVITGDKALCVPIETDVGKVLLMALASANDKKLPKSVRAS